MKEILLFLCFMPLALMVAINTDLQKAPTFVATPQPTVNVVVPTPGPFVGPPSNVIEAAMQWLGTPYLWGGCTRKGVDCSCAVRNWWSVMGVNLPRTTVDQIRFTTSITRQQAVVGDLVFFDGTCSDCGPNPTHVGLYLGDGLMIDAGDPVQIEPIFSGHNARFGRVPR